MWKQVLPFLSVLVLAPGARAYDERALLSLARESVRYAVNHSSAPKTRGGDAAQPVFVTIERGGQVIGCRGTLRARTASLQAEVAAAARDAARVDPRYRPLSRADLSDFRVTITVVRAMRSIAVQNLDSLDAGEGLVLQSGEKFGIVLPWEGREPRTRLRWAYVKAGVAENAPVRLFRLAAERFRG